MLDETFVIMNNHDPKYAISDLGRIFNKDTGKFLNPYIHKSRSNLYWRIAINQKLFMLHCLVAEYHLPLPDCDSKDKVDHVDNNTLNPAATNLTWISNSENIKKSHDITTILIEGRVWKYKRRSPRKKSSTAVGSASNKLKRIRPRQTHSPKKERAFVETATTNVA